MSARMEAMRGEGVTRSLTGRTGGGRIRWVPGLLLTIFLAGFHGAASGQITNQITRVSPDSASQGTNDLLVTFTLDTDAPQAPPPGDGPQSVMIGSISGTSVTHASHSIVTARFDIPAGEPEGAKDATISFNIPGGTLVYSKAAAFRVLATGDHYTIAQTLSDEAQRNTIAFDGLAFLTGCLGAQSFLPPGKVADYSGFQYLRDNDPTHLGHNTDFVTIVAFNVLNILTAEQIDRLVASAQVQVQQINEFAYERFPLMKALRRQIDGDLPAGSAGLDSSAVVACAAGFYRLDGSISYDRARLMGGILTSLTPAQRASLESLKALNGVGNWNRTLPDPLQPLRLDHDVNVAVMTYASEMYAWYAGSIEADVYFCPERQGTYFGSFYLKDWPAMGNPDYTINEQLTASAGQDFLAALTAPQVGLLTGLVDVQRSALHEIVDRRRDIATLLRAFQSGTTPDSAAVLALSARYGELDGQIAYCYATRFSILAHDLNTGQEVEVEALADSLGYLPPPGAFLYSAPIDMPAIRNTDFLFGVPVTGLGDGGRPGDGLSLNVTPNPAPAGVAIEFVLPAAGTARVAIHDVSGRVVSVLARGALNGGAHRLTWPGSDGAGRPLPGGVYFVRMETRAGARCRRLALVR